MKKVLLTGATGFIGRQCLPLLVGQGYEVHAVSSRSIGGTKDRIRWHQVDLSNPSQVKALVAVVRPSHLLHLAWYTAPGKFWNSLENLRWVQASLGLLQEFASNGGRRVVVAGTCAEYDWREGMCSELTTPLAPSTFYGVCKHSLQLLFAGMEKEMGFSAGWGRIFHLYGPHEHPDRLVSSVIRALLSRAPARCSHGQQVRDYMYVADVADAFVALLGSAVTGPVNIASGMPVTVEKIVRTIARKLDQPHLLQLGATPIAESEPALITADVSRLREEVGWRPAYDLSRGLDETIHWWKTEASARNEIPV
jgi:nucleoside-diphosphate-sugar epimerase